MIINANISILCSADGVQIEIQDENSRAVFCKIEMEPEDFVAAIGRLAHQPCKAKVRGLDLVGKKHECAIHEFELTPGMKIYDLALSTCPEGWIPDNYFNSKDSFFTKGNKNYGRCTIRRWV